MYGSDQCRSASIVTVAPPSRSRQLLLDRLRDARRVDPVGDLREEPELEPVGGLSGLVVDRSERDALSGVVLGEPGRLDVALVENDRLAALVASRAGA